MPYRQQAEVVLGAWREVERALENAPSDSPDAEQLQAEAARLRDDYQSLMDAAEQAHAETESSSGPVFDKGPATGTAS